MFTPTLWAHRIFGKSVDLAASHRGGSVHADSEIRYAVGDRSLERPCLDKVDRWNAAAGHFNFPSRGNIFGSASGDAPATGAIGRLGLLHISPVESGLPGSPQECLGHLSLHRLLRQTVFTVKIDILRQAR